MLPTTVVAHAMHDSAALGIPPVTLAVAITGILTVAVVLPQRADEDRVALPPPVVPAGPDPAGTELPKAPDAADRPADATVPERRVARAAAGLLGLVLAGLVVVGLAGPDAPNLAALAVANVVLPATVVTGLLGGGPRRAGAVRTHVHPLTWVLLVPVVLTHPAGSAGGAVAGGIVLGYVTLSLVGRVRVGPGWWADGDPLGVLAGLVRRLSPLARGADGARRPWLSSLWQPLSVTQRAVLLVVLAGGIARTARFLPVWLDLGAGQPIAVRAVAAAALTVYVGLLVALVHRAVKRRTGADTAVAAVAVLAAVLLANDAAPALFTLHFAGTLLSDPLGVGVDLFGTADRTIGTGLLLSPLVWLWQLVVVLLGGALGATVQRDLDRHADRTGAGSAVAVAGLATVVVLLLLLG